MLQALRPAREARALHLLPCRLFSADRPSPVPCQRRLPTATQSTSASKCRPHAFTEVLRLTCRGYTTTHHRNECAHHYRQRPHHGPPSLSLAFPRHGSDSVSQVHGVLGNRAHEQKNVFAVLCLQEASAFRAPAREQAASGVPVQTSEQRSLRSASERCFGTPARSSLRGPQGKACRPTPVSCGWRGCALDAARDASQSSWWWGRGPKK